MNGLLVSEIFCVDEQDFNLLSDFLKKFPVNVVMDEDELHGEGLPLMIVGWEYFKSKYPNHNILDLKVKGENVSWSYSIKEDEDQYFNKIQDFVNNSLLDWFPKEFKVINPFFDGELNDFVLKSFNKEDNVFIYYNLECLYINSGGKNYCLDKRAYEMYSDDFYNTFSSSFDGFKVIPFSYNNLIECFGDKEFNYDSFESYYWVKTGLEITEKEYFDIIQDFDYKKYMPFFMNLMGLPVLDLEDKKFLDRMRFRDSVTSYCSTREVNFSNAENTNKRILNLVNGSYRKKFVYSNKRTITNRVVCRDDLNIQNLPKDSLTRKDIVSDFKGGNILVCDYTSFETRISILLTKNEAFINYFKDKDIHEEVGKKLFSKDVLTRDERHTAKLFNHALLYGASYNKLLEIVSQMIPIDTDERIYRAKRVLRPVIEKTEEIIARVKKEGYLQTQWGVIIKPSKDYAAYNNWLQTIASELLCNKIAEIREYLKDKKSKFLFQVHDSMIFDICSEEEKGVGRDLMNIMGSFGDFFFPIGYKYGPNYMDLSQKEIFNEKKLA